MAKMGQPSGYMNPKAPGNKPKAKVKVSQATIDHIKKMGMTKALKEIQMLGRQSRMTGKNAATTAASGKELLGAEFATGVKRMYGERRFKIASSPKIKKAVAPKASTGGKYVGSMFVPAKTKKK